jgi:hypothetical protein
MAYLNIRATPVLDCLQSIPANESQNHSPVSAETQYAIDRCEDSKPSTERRPFTPEGPDLHQGESQLTTVSTVNIHSTRGTDVTGRILGQNAGL